MRVSLSKCTGLSIPALAIRCGGILLLTALLSSGARASDSYKFDVIAQTGMSAAGGTLGAVGNQPSINDGGAVAFTGQVQSSSTSFSAVFIGQGGGNALQWLSAGLTGPQKPFSAAVQINNNLQVTTREGNPGSPPYTIIRRWEGSGSYKKVARSPNAGTPHFPNSPYESVNPFPGVNNNGDVVFLALPIADRNPGDVVKLVYANNSVIPSLDTVTSCHSYLSMVAEVTLPSQALRPVMADNGQIAVTLDDGKGNSEIRLYDPTKTTLTPEGNCGGFPVSFNDFSKSYTSIAQVGASAFFTDLGQSPGISDDGQIVAFYGNLTPAGASALHTTAGPGIFASINNSGTRVMQRVAGLSTGAVSFVSFDLDSRVAVSSQASQQIATVVYLATDTGGKKGLYTSRLSVAGAGTVSAPTAVVKQGDSITGLAGVVQGLSLYDSVNATGDLAFAVTTATNAQAVVRARSLAPNLGKNLGDCRCTGTAEGNPINAGTGNKFQVETDFVGAAHTQLALRRSYNSQDSTASAFGAGWHSTYHRALTQASPTTVTLTSADGRVDTFTKKGSDWVTDPDVTSRLSAVLNASNQQTGWQLVTAEDTTELYALTGQLISITTRAGLVTALSYDANGHLASVTGPFGHTLTFTADANGLVTQMTAPDGGVYRYAYDTQNNLITVTYPDSTVRRYLYENPSFPNALTGIVDENGNRFATYTYDAQGRATATQHAGGAELTKVAYNGDGTATATDPRGNTHGYTFTTQFGLVKPAAISGAPVQTAGGKAFTYDDNGFIASRTDFNDNLTTYTHDARGLELSRTEAKGTPLARTITTTWHPTFHLPTKITEPNRVTTFTYDAHGNLLQKTITAGSLARTWKYTYNTNGQVLTVDGPRTDVPDVTSFTYDAKGDVATITDAVGHVTSLTSYDANGRPLSITDPNGLVTTLAYTPRGLLKSRTVGSEVTTFTYDKAENLSRVRLPDGSTLTYAYDKAHRLIGIKDTLGNLIAYTLDAASNRTKEQVFDPSNVLTQTRRHVYDEVNRLAQDIGAQNQTTTYTYDAEGNLTQVTDPLNHTTLNAYDGLNRLVQATDPNTGVTKFGYDANDNLVAVTDPLGNKTTYVYTGLGDQHSTASPDTGLTYNSRDAAGNVLTRTDARGQRLFYTYDALNRVTTIKFTGGPVTFTYDQGTNGIGHLTQMTDPAGQTTWEYDAHGRVLSKTQKNGTLSLVTQYSYDPSGRLASLTYPSGQVITLTYTKGLVTQLAANSTPLLSGIQYEPFGPATSWFWGNGTAYVQQFDLDGRVAAYDLGTTRDRQLTYDAAGRITDYTDTTAAQSQHFTYDAADQLTGFAVGSGSTTTYNYDQNGNRTKWLTASGADSYSYAANSNQLLSIAGTHPHTYTHDAAGNITGDGPNTFVYDGRGRLTQVTTSSGTTKYLINGLGQRVGKPGRFFVYDEAGHLLGEYNALGQAIEETVYLGDMPAAVLQGASRFFVYADQLNAPRALMNISNGIVWRWDTGPFGTGLPVGVVTYNLRFPGQHFDQETGLFYNYYRDYNPFTGRYIQSDPIGLVGGINTYAYVVGNPVNGFDPLGLQQATTPFSDQDPLKDSKQAFNDWWKDIKKGVEIEQELAKLREDWNKSDLDHPEKLLDVLKDTLDIAKRFVPGPVKNFLDLYKKGIETVQKAPGGLEAAKRHCGTTSINVNEHLHEQERDEYERWHP